jgi:hypothetical protein
MSSVLPWRGSKFVVNEPGISTVLALARTPREQDMTPVNAKSLTAGKHHTSKSLRRASALALERLRTEKIPDAPDEVDVEAAYAAMIGLRAAEPTQADALVSFWARRSPAYAVDVAVRTLTVAIDTLFADDTAAVVERDHTAAWLYSSLFVKMAGNRLPWGAWHGLRAVLARADLRAYKAAKSRAATHRKTLAPAFRALVSFAFPTETAWLKEDAKEALSHAELPKYGALLLATRLPLATATRIADAMPSEHYAVDFLTTIVALHGDRAVAVLVAFLKKKAPHVAARRALVAALGLIRTPEVAQIFAAHLGDKHFHPGARDYFKSAPELVPALRGVASGRSSDAGIAKTILRTVNGDARG